MLHSRGFVANENQAFAGQSRTPAASRLASSPHRRNMTTGRRPAAHLLGQDASSVAPKQLFGDSSTSKTPARPLMGKNINRTPGPSRSNGSPSKDGSSPSKGNGAMSSPLKKGGELGTRTASSSTNVLRSTNGKQRQQSTDMPFGKGAMTPAPTELGKRAKTMIRQSSFVTPAANIGRAGQIKARMGEMMDAEFGLSQPKVNLNQEQATAEPVAVMTEEEKYPEIERMPSSHLAHHPVFEFPDELDNLPRAKEVGMRLASFSPFEIKKAGPEDLEFTKPRLDNMDQAALELDCREAGNDSDDDPWPDVPVPDTQSEARSTTGVRTPITTASRGILRPTPIAMARSATAAPKPAPSAVRTGGLQRSIAASSMPARPRPTAPRATPSQRKPFTSATAPGRVSIKPAPAQKPKTMLNPALIDTVNDDLGKQTADKIRAYAIDEDVQSLCLDLGPPPSDD